MIPTTILRHPKERLSKCSLQPLREHPALTFHRARPGFALEAEGFTLLAVDAPALSEADAGRPLLLLDSTWRLLPQLEACLRGEPVRRSLPTHWRTAYPRTSKLGPEPDHGLASVEALYAAWLCLGHDAPELLANYHWRERFRQINGLPDTPGQ